MKQLIMFPAGQDLPLFSGTAPIAQESVFVEQETPQEKQLSFDNIQDKAHE